MKLTVDIVLMILVIGGMAAVFEKAGEAWWSAIIPIWNIYILLKITKTSAWWLAAVFVEIILMSVSGFASFFGIIVPGFGSVARGSLFLFLIAGVLALVTGIVFALIVPSRLSRMFGHGVGMSLGLILFPFIFYPILGFDKSSYTGSAAAAPFVPPVVPPVQA